MLVPFDRVRTAGAPSYVIRLSGVRAPLIFDGPWVKLKLRFASEPPRVPGTKLAMKMGLRPFNSSASICSRVTSFCTEADSVCSKTAAAETSTV